jgi:uncharacterized protein (DUF427 family)
MTTITVKDITRGEVLAQGEQDEDAILLEGAYYFLPEQVKRDNLIISNRTYTCAYKGLCYWLDLQGPNGVIRNAARRGGREKIVGRMPTQMERPGV